MQSGTSFADDELGKTVQSLIEAAKRDYAAGNRTLARQNLNHVFDILEAEHATTGSSDHHAKLLEVERSAGHFCEDQGDREGALFLFKRSLALAETRFYPGGHLE